MRCPRRRLSRPALGVGAGDVEIAERDKAEVVRLRGVAEHDLGHQLRGPIGRHRSGRRRFRNRIFLRVAVDRCGRRKDEILDARLDGGGNQATRFDGVVQVVAERIGDGIGHDDRPGEMDDRCHAVSAYRFLDAIGIGDVGDNERSPRRDGPSEPGRQVVDDDDLFASIQ